MTAQPYVIEVEHGWDMMNRVERLSHEAAHEAAQKYQKYQKYVTEVARDIMKRTTYQGTPIYELEYRLSRLIPVDPRKDEMDSRKEYVKRIKQAEKNRKNIIALYKAIGTIPSTNLENLTDITNDLQSEYKRLLVSQYTSREKKQGENALMNMAAKIKDTLSDKIEDLEEQLTTAELRGEITSKIIRNLIDTRTDYRTAFNDETRHSMKVIRYDRAEREYARLALNLQGNLKGFNNRVLRMIDTWNTWSSKNDYWK